MKNNDLNPWPIIRWSAALVVYVLTVAIAVSLIREKNGTLNDLTQSIKKEKDESLVLNRQRKYALDLCDKIAAEKSEWMSKFEALAESADELLAANKRLDTVKKEREALTALQNSQPQSPATTVPRPYYTAPQPQAVAAPIIPSWTPPAPSVVTRTIRENAMAEHKTNYSLLNYEIERQTEAFAKLVRYYKTADPFIKSAINMASLEYGTNYSSFAYSVERQIEARQKFGAR